MTAPARLHGVAVFATACANNARPTLPRRVGIAPVPRGRNGPAAPWEARLRRTAPSVAYRLTRRRFALSFFVGAPYDVRSNRLGLLVIEHGLERSHAGTLHRPVEHDLVPEVVAEIIRMAQIRNGAP